MLLKCRSETEHVNRFLSKKKKKVLSENCYLVALGCCPMEFYPFEDTSYESRRPMLARKTEKAEQEQVITCLLVWRHELLPWPLQYCCDSGRRNRPSSPGICLYHIPFPSVQGACSLRPRSQAFQRSPCLEQMQLTF